jgi:hypothetical protein
MVPINPKPVVDIGHLLPVSENRLFGAGSQLKMATIVDSRQTHQSIHIKTVEAAIVVDTPTCSAYEVCRQAHNSTCAKLHSHKGIIR